VTLTLALALSFATRAIDRATRARALLARARSKPGETLLGALALGEHPTRALAPVVAELAAAGAACVVPVPDEADEVEMRRRVAHKEV